MPEEQFGLMLEQMERLARDIAAGYSGGRNDCFALRCDGTLELNKRPEQCYLPV